MAEKELAEQEVIELLNALEDYQPIIPEEVTEYYLKEAGFQSSDPRLAKLISLAAQKFVTEIANDAMSHTKIRMQDASRRTKDKKAVLTMEDLSKALKEYGIDADTPPYFANRPGLQNVAKNAKK